jgi:hypothetical protein
VLKNVSPKVLWPLIVGLFLNSILTNVNLITPQMLAFLGPWEDFVVHTATLILGGVAGYFAVDPLRQAVAAPEAPAPAAPAADPVETAKAIPAVAAQIDSAPAEPTSPFSA